MGERTYSVDIGTQRVDLPLVSLNEQLALALLITVDMGVEIIVLDDAACQELLGTFIREHPELWNEDIGR